MKLRHAAALALLGWYLMAPLPGNDPIPNPGARSFAKWVHLVSFDSAEKCEAARPNVVRAGVGGPQLMGYPPEEVKKVLLLSQCIAADDPRLKELSK